MPTVNGLTVTRTGTPLNDASFQISNGTSTAGTFLPTFIFTSNFVSGLSIGGLISGRIQSTTVNDIGIIIEARTKSATALSQGYIVSFRSFTTDYVRIAHNGNMLLQNGGTFTDGGQRLQVQGTTLLNGNVTFSSATGMTWDATNGRLGVGTNAPSDQLHISNSAVLVNTVVKLSVHPNHANIINFRNADNSVQGGFLATGSSFSFGTYTTNQANLLGGSGGIGLRVLNTSASSLVVYGGNASADLGVKYLQVYGNTGNVLIQNGGTFTDSGERLQVTGTMKVTGASSFGGDMTLTLNQNAVTGFTIINNNTGANAASYFRARTTNSGTYFDLVKVSNTSTVYKIIAPNDALLYNSGTSGDIAILNDWSSGNIKFAAGASSAAHMTIKANGRINMSSLPTSPTGLSSGDLWNNLGMINIV
jgi:hypothetical protein